MDRDLAGRRLLAVTEEELQRIVLDIHDGPVQNLFAALSQLSIVRRRLTDKRDAAGAAGCLREAVAIRTWQLGPAHPDTLDTRQSLADVLFATDDYGATEAVLLDGLSPPPGRERANAAPLPQQQARLLRQLDSLYRTRGALQPAAAAEARARWAKVMWRGVEQAIAELDDRIGEGGHNDPNLLARRAA
jgi:hypothetical protein